VKRYANWDAVLGYCLYSANPVGRLVLYLCGYRDEQRQRLSDATCTALQLANFWQDVSRDLDIGRIYIPLDGAAVHGLSENDIVERRFDERYVGLMKDLIIRTRALFAEGRPLAKMVYGRGMPRLSCAPVLPTPTKNATASLAPRTATFTMPSFSCRSRSATPWLLFMLSCASSTMSRMKIKVSSRSSVVWRNGAPRSTRPLPGTLSSLMATLPCRCLLKPYMVK